MEMIHKGGFTYMVNPTNYILDVNVNIQENSTLYNS